jgi:hypothetical protein
MSPLSPKQVLEPQFGPFMGNERGVGFCYGLIPFGAAIGVVIASLFMNQFTRRYLFSKVEPI